MAGLSDDVITAIVEAKKIGEDVDNNHPMRHQFRNMNDMACRILSDAAYQATGLAYQARQLAKDYDKSLLEFSESLKGGTNG